LVGWLYFVSMVFAMLIITALIGTLRIEKTVAQSDNSSLLYSPRDSPFGFPFVKWAQDWWNWDGSLNKAEHPQNDYYQHRSQLGYTSEKCSAGQNQSSSVWFLALADPKQEPILDRTCIVPEGKAIMLAPPTVGQCDSGIEGVDTDEKIRDCAMAGQVGASLDIFVDGVKQNYPLVENRVTSGFFNVTWTTDNIVDGSPGVFRSLTDGYYIFLKPLSRGEHVLYYEGKVTGNPDKNFNWAQEGTYRLKVQ
jgi:hypothetical protein